MNTVVFNRWRHGSRVPQGLQNRKEKKKMRVVKRLGRKGQNNKRRENNRYSISQNKKKTVFRTIKVQGYNEVKKFEKVERPKKI